jgi:uncharacterized protein YqgV (UPF0045/DUF77 family)
MVISAQISRSPLRQEHLGPAMHAMSTALTARDLRSEIGPMSTVVTREAAVVFAALHEAFVEAAGTGQVVMTVTLSNACPLRG